MNNALQGNELTVAQLAIELPGALAVFTKYNIDYCCGGHRSLVEACHRIGLDPETIQNEISSISSTEPALALRPDKWSTTLLVDYILQNHHEFVKRAIPELETLLEKVCDRHGNDSPELLQIREIFSDLAEDLTSHMEKEELVLFPAIKRIDAQRMESHPIERMIQAPILAMEDDHKTAGDLIKQIRILSGNYTPPDFACPTFRITYQRLREFDNDLMRHVHLENNILFDRFKKQPSPSSCSI